MIDFVGHFNQRLDEMLAFLTRLVEHESPTTDKTAVDKLADMLVGELTASGAQIERVPHDEVGDLTIARWNDGASAKPILILTHIDTVWDLGTLEKMPIRHDDEGRLYGPGTFDMKGGITAVIYALRALHDLKLMPDRPIHMLLTTDEEMGSVHSLELIEQMARESALVMVTEPAIPDGSLKTARKAVGTFFVRTYGVASHAGGAHGEGTNAIVEMAQQLTRIAQWTDYELGSTVSPGVVQGGTRSNVVPESCFAAIDVRTVTAAEQERITMLMEEGLEPIMPGARVEVSGGFERAPMERNALMIETFERAQAIGAELGLTLTEGSTGGGSDGNLTAALGIATLDGLGPKGAGAHALHEHIVVSHLAERAALMAGVLQKWPL